MSSSEKERIKDEYQRRKKEIPNDFYSLEHPGNLFMYQGRSRAVIKLLSQQRVFPLTDKSILEVGCGAGSWLVDFESWGANQKRLHGMDLLEDRVVQARRRLPEAEIKEGDVSMLPWPDQSFDLVLQSTVFSSILDSEMKKKAAQEMVRVLKPEGTILWYDFFFDNPKNSEVRGIKKGEIRALFADCRVSLKKVTLAPPLSRWLAPKAWGLCRFLESFSLFNTHYLGIIHK